jgi:nicotinamide-nucleotide amidase
LFTPPRTRSTQNALHTGEATTVFDPSDITLAAGVLDAFRARKQTLATAESCTGGLIAALLTEVPGASDVLDRGFVTYSNGAKCDLLGVPATLIGRFGAVSAEVAVAMAGGALRASTADLSVAVTGVAGPGGGTPAKPVGLVYIGAQARQQPAVVIELRLGDIGRGEIRRATTRSALGLLSRIVTGQDPDTALRGATP